MREEHKIEKVVLEHLFDSKTGRYFLLDLKNLRWAEADVLGRPLTEFKDLDPDDNN